MCVDNVHFVCVCCVDDLLPVSLAGGINVLESGQTWLAKHLTGRRVWFKPLRITTDNRLECIVHTRVVLFPASVYLCLCVYVCASEVMFLPWFVVLFVYLSLGRITQTVVEK